MQFATNSVKNSPNFNVNQATILVQREFQTKNTPSNSQTKIRKVFTFLSILVLASFQFLPQSVQAKETATAVVMSECFMEGSGYIAIMQGLTTKPIVLEFGSQKTYSKNDPEVQVTIMTETGAIIYDETSQEPIVDFSSLALAAGNYTLIVQVGGVSQEVAFSKS